MTSINISGITSGLKTDDIIEALMASAAGTQNQLKKKLTAQNSTDDVLRSLNTSLAAMNTSVKTGTTAIDFQKFTASSSAPSVSVDATGSKGPASLSIEVKSTATRHSIVSASGTDFGSSQVTIQRQGQPALTLDAASSSFDDIASAINKADTGVTATKVSAGKDPVTGEPLFRLQLTSKDTGAANGFTAAGTGTDPFAALGSAVLATGADALVTLYAGTAAEVDVTSDTNSFDTVVEGLKFTISAAAIGAGPIELGVTPDLDASRDKAKELIGNVNKILDLVASKSSRGGPLSTDSFARALKDQLIGAVLDPVDGQSPWDIGVTVDKFGVLTFDEAKFTKAMGENPQVAGAFLENMATNLTKVTDQYSHKYDGLITQRINAGSSMATAIEKQISDWDRRLEMKRTTMERQFIAMEKMLTQINGLGDALNASLGALPVNQKNNN